MTALVAVAGVSMALTADAWEEPEYWTPRRIAGNAVMVALVMGVAIRNWRGR